MANGDGWQQTEFYYCENANFLLFAGSVDADRVVVWGVYRKSDDTWVEEGDADTVEEARAMAIIAARDRERRMQVV